MWARKEKTGSDRENCAHTCTASILHVKVKPTTVGKVKKKHHGARS